MVESFFFNLKGQFQIDLSRTDFAVSPNTKWISTDDKYHHRISISKVCIEFVGFSFVYNFKILECIILFTWFLFVCFLHQFFFNANIYNLSIDLLMGAYPAANLYLFFN